MKQSLNFFAIMKFDDKNYFLLYKQRYLLCEKNNLFFSYISFKDYKITKIVNELIMNLIVDDKYTETIFILSIITKVIEQHLLTIVNELITKHYVKLFVVTNNEKDHKKQMKITLFIKLINEFINFIDLIQIRSRKARGIFISKINSASRPRHFYQSDHSFFLFDNFLKKEISSSKARDRLIRRIKFFMKF